MKPFPKSALLKFDKALRKLRKAKGLTQEQLAEQIDLAPRHYQKLESGEVTPTFGVLYSLKKSLKVDWNSLLG